MEKRIMEANTTGTVRIGQLELRFMVGEPGATVFEFTVPPNARVPAPHFHRDADADDRQQEGKERQGRRGGGTGEVARQDLRGVRGDGVQGTRRVPGPRPLAGRHQTVRALEFTGSDRGEVKHDRHASPATLAVERER